MRRRVLYWYHFYLNYPSGSRLSKTILEVSYWRGLVMQAELFAKICKTCQQLKNIKILYGNLPPKNITELKPLDLVHVDLICPYRNSMRQQKLRGTIIRNNVILTFMKIIDPTTGWFKIV